VRPVTDAEVTADSDAGGPPVAAPQVHSIPRLRLAAGRRLSESSSTVPHVLSVVEVDYANVDRVRKAHRHTWRAEHGHSLTYLPFVATAVCEALAQFPHLNAHLDGETLVVHPRVNLGIAVDLDHQGLVVPVVHACDSLRLGAVASAIHRAAEKAKQRALVPDDMAGGTFTISNNGSAGSELTAPIINIPQVAILSTDAVRRRPVVVHTAAGDEAVVVHPVGNLSLCWDHRAIDGAYAAGFLCKVRDILEQRDWDEDLPAQVRFFALGDRPNR